MEGRDILFSHMQGCAVVIPYFQAQIICIHTYKFSLPYSVVHVQRNYI